jgi:hypothetical protein
MTVNVVGIVQAALTAAAEPAAIPVRRKPARAFGRHPRFDQGRGSMIANCEATTTATVAIAAQTTIMNPETRQTRHLQSMITAKHQT